MRDNYLFIGNPGNLAPARLRDGMTKDFQQITHQDAVYMDTPGLADRQIERRAADAITTALRQTGSYKIFFIVRLQYGRVQSEDLATIETVLDSIDMKDIPFVIVINNVKSRQYAAMMEKEEEFFEVITLINSSKYKTPYITFIPTLECLDEKDNQCVKLPTDVETFLRLEAPSTVVPHERVDNIQLGDFKRLPTTFQMEELLKKPRFVDVLVKVVGVTQSAVIKILKTEPGFIDLVSSGDYVGMVSALIRSLVGHMWPSWLQWFFVCQEVLPRGLTKEFQTRIHDNVQYMDTPGLADRNIQEKAAAAITEALRQSGTYKLFFMVRLENGRVVSDDLATIEIVLSSIELDEIPFAVIVNNVKNRGADYLKVVTLINSIKHKTSNITFIPVIDDLDEEDNAVTKVL
ncbi:P-loop containing nucleoside triphosphate hydrolase [Phytophthora cactorum]|nr:P-loop containing nucleoside triphosphate hydrolase [Phytophthora cactorum]